MCRFNERQWTWLVYLRHGLTLQMYTRTMITSSECHHLRARCSVWWQPAFGTTRERAEGLAEPIDVSLSLREECAGPIKVPQVHFFTIRAHHQGGSHSTSGKVFPVILDAHLWRSKVEALVGLNSLQLLTQPRAHKNACGLWLTDVTSAPCQPDLGVGAESEATPNSPFTGHSVLAGRTAESIKLWNF